MCGFACQECGHKFKTIKAAERASFGPKGCPKCGGSDIDLASEGITIKTAPITDAIGPATFPVKSASRYGMRGER